MKFQYSIRGMFWSLRERGNEVGGRNCRCNCRVSAYLGEIMKRIWADFVLQTEQYRIFAAATGACGIRDIEQ